MNIDANIGLNEDSEELYTDILEGDINLMLAYWTHNAEPNIEDLRNATSNVREYIGRYGNVENQA